MKWTWTEFVPELSLHYAWNFSTLWYQVSSRYFLSLSTMNWDDCIDHTPPPCQKWIQILFRLHESWCPGLVHSFSLIGNHFWSRGPICRQWFSTQKWCKSESDPPCIVDDRNECWLKTGKNRHDVSVGPWLGDPRVCIDHSTSQAKGWDGSFPDRVQVLTYFETLNELR